MAEPGALGGGSPIGTPAWRDRLAARLGALPPAGGRRLALGQVVRAPDGERSWTVVAGGGAPAAVHDGVTHAEVCLVASLDAAELLASGTSAADLLADGRLKVRGDGDALVEGHEALAHLAAALRGDDGTGAGDGDGTGEGR